ncbi:MAG: CHAT domain-containing protein [Bacteroidales bacterium]|nr:CHAT domain-containing protein [Bacteroidales bacterium]
MKSAPPLFFLSNFSHSIWLFLSYLIISSGLFLSVPDISAQTANQEELLKQKALLFKNRIEYDSALIYYSKLSDLLETTGDKKEEILNELNFCDIYVLQRNFVQAQAGLEEAANKIHKGFPDDIDLGPELYQVKGSYLLAQGEMDSAKLYLERSIKLRTAHCGTQDTSLHYAYNKLGNLYLAKANYDLAFDCHQTALVLSLKKSNPVNFLTASSYQNLGIAAHMKGDYKLAEDCYTKSLHLKEELFGQNDPALARIYINLGKFSMDLSKYDQALEYYDKAEQLLLSRFDRNDLIFAYVYLNKGNIFTLKGDYEKSISYLSKARSIREKVLGTNNVEVLSALMDLGYVYEKKGELNRAIDFYTQSTKIKDNPFIIKAYRNLGNIYKTLNEPDSADKYYNLSIDFANKFFSGNSYDLALCYQYYGMFLEKSRNNDKSQWYYAKAADIFIQLFGTKNKDLSKIFLLQSEYFLAKADYNSALIKIQGALTALLPGFEESDPRINPKIEDIVLDLYLPNALSLKAKALYLQYLQNKNIKDLNLSLETIDLTLAVIEEIRKTYNEEESQMILNKDARTVIDLGVMVTYSLYKATEDKKYLADAFHFIEKGQAIILLSALRGLDAQSDTDIPHNVLDLENTLSRELATYNGFLYQERQKKVPDPGKLQLWSDKIFSLRLSHDSLLSSYKKSYPEYFRLKYDFTTISADSAIKSLPTDQAIIEYHVTDSLVFGFILSDGLLSAEILGNKSSLIRKLDSLRQFFIRNEYFNAGQQEFEVLTTISTKLYNILILPFEKAIPGKRLIIIPDGELGYLSFDLLLKEKPINKSQGYNDLPWLIRSNPISYSSSSTIHFEQSSQLTRKVTGKLIAFAPSYNYTRNTRNAGLIDSVMLKLSPIKGTKEEINAISGQFQTKKLFDLKATETYFKEHAGEYSILHLAMHTIIDNQNPLYSKLVFTLPEPGSPDDGYLNTYELFGLHLPGQLAVLSACNTGSGKLERGEGIISLARGFFYAGIPSVVMTLWEIEDHSSANLMAMFYENLKIGLPNDIALQRAKIAYLEGAGKLQSHPYFWAGYVCIGKTDPVIYTTTAWKPLHFVLITGGILLFFTIIYFFINRRVYFHIKWY